MSNRRINARVRTPQAPGGPLSPNTDMFGRPAFTNLAEIRSNTIGRTPLTLPGQGGMDQGMGQGGMMPNSGRDAAGNRMNEPMLPNEAMFGSERDEAGNRVNYNKDGDVVRVKTNRINARVRNPQPPGGSIIPDTDLHGRPTFTGLNQIKYNSPLAQMGREMSPAQTMLNTPMDDEDYDPFDMDQTRLNESAWNRRSF
jgi:hypothetical protein